MRVGRSSRETRTLVTGLVVVPLILLVGRGVPVLLQWGHDEHARSSAVLTEYDRARAELRSLGAVRDSAQARQLRLGDAFPSLLHARGDAGLVAELIEEFNQHAEESGVHVITIEGHADTSATTRYLPVLARAEVIGDVGGLMRLLALIESSDVRLRVNELSIAQAAPAAPAKEPELLHATVGLQGLARWPARPQRSRRSPAHH